MMPSASTFLLQSCPIWLTHRISNFGLAFAGHRPSPRSVPQTVLSAICLTQSAVALPLGDIGLWGGENAKEWFCDLPTIMNVILTLRDDYILDMSAHINVSNWKLETPVRLGRWKKGIRTSEREMDILKGISTNSLTDVKVLTTKQKSKRLRKKPTQVDTFKPA